MQEHDKADLCTADPRQGLLLGDVGVLPVELVIHIFSFLDWVDAILARGVCKACLISRDLEAAGRCKRFTYKEDFDTGGLLYW